MQQKTKLGLVIATIIGSVYATEATAIDLYVDQKTQQIFAEPGPGRTKLGTFQQVDEPNKAGLASEKSELAAQKTEIAKIKQEQELKNTELKALEEHVNDPSLGKVRMGEDGVKWESAEGDFSLKLNGRVQLDSQVSMNQSGVPQSSTLADGTTIRRARLSAEGAMFKEFGYKFEYDFTRGNGSTAGGVTDAFMTWNGYSPLTATVGQFKEPISIEEATSDIQTSFIERNMATNAFIDNNNVFKMGLGLKVAQPRWTAQSALQTESMGNGSGTNDTSSTNSNGNANRNGGSGDTGWGITGRVTGLPWMEDKNHLLHIGASGSQRYLDVNPSCAGAAGPNSSNICGANFGAALDSNVDRSLVLNTGVISNNSLGRSTQTVTRAGGEASVVYGPLSLQGEYLQAQVAGNGLSNNNLNGYYGFASFFLTGESRNYILQPKGNLYAGVFDRIKPNHNFSTTGGGIGAWELLAGYDYLDLNSGIIHGGRADTGKVGLNWYPNSRIRVMANFIHVFDLETTTSTSSSATNVNSTAKVLNGTHPDIFEMRTQLDF